MESIKNINRVPEVSGKSTQTPADRIADLGGITHQKADAIEPQKHILTDEMISRLVNIPERAKELILQNLRQTEAFELLGALTLKENDGNLNKVGKAYVHSVATYEYLFNERYKKQIETIEAANECLEKEVYPLGQNTENKLNKAA